MNIQGKPQGDHSISGEATLSEINSHNRKEYSKGFQASRGIGAKTSFSVAMELMFHPPAPPFWPWKRVVYRDAVAFLIDAVCTLFILLVCLKNVLRIVFL